MTTPHADEALARFLAPHTADGRAFSPARLAALDRGADFPAEACAALDAFGLAAHYVPEQYGGRLRALDELTQMWRVVARHDMTVAIGHGKTFLGVIGVWLAGDRAQCDDLAAEVLAGAPVSWGLTERAHGADLLASELRAERHEAGWRIDGEKWLINNATRGQLMCVLARTGAARDARGCSLFLVDRRRLPSDGARCLPKVKTLGIRGADISGIAFRAAHVPDRALIGPAGAGVEIVLKALQLTRSACVGLSLGAADHAFRLTLAFARARELYGRRLIDLPMARRALGEAFAMHYAGEVVASAVTRAASGMPAEMSVLSAIAKAFVPSTVEQVLGKLGELLGARAYLDEVHAHGAFQKLERDHRIVPIFDGATVVNRQALINQFPMLSRGWVRRDHDADALERVFDPARAVPPLPFDALALVSMRGCGIVQALPASLGVLADEAAARGAAPALVMLATQLTRLADALMEQIAAHQPTARAVPAVAFELARRYELCFAGASCIRRWLHDREDESIATDPRAVWLCASLTWLIGEMEPRAAEPYHACYDALAADMLDAFADDDADGGEGGVSLRAARAVMERAA